MYAAKAITNEHIYFYEVLHCQIVHRKISTFTSGINLMSRNIIFNLTLNKAYQKFFFYFDKILLLSVELLLLYYSINNIFLICFKQDIESLYAFKEKVKENPLLYTEKILSGDTSDIPTQTILEEVSRDDFLNFIS